MYAIPNLRAVNAFELHRPWEDWKNYPIPAGVADKAAFEAWRTDITTKHAFISGVAGMEPRMRVTAEKEDGDAGNPPALVEAVIADYDTPVSDDKALVLLQEPPVPFVPNFLVDSFSREGERIKRRLVWRFEVPLRVSGTRHAKALFAVLEERLKLRGWLSGFDRAAHKPAQYFEIGRRWTPLSAAPVPKMILYGWAAEAASKVRFTDGKERPAVSLDLIAKAVADKFPGRWQGDFSSGAQGVRFWDPEADNERACLVGEHGMICFTGPKSFVPWEEIFGAAAVDAMRGDQWGPFLNGFYYDGVHIWHQTADRRGWVTETKEDARRIWRVAGISASRRGGLPSDIDRMEDIICTQNRVHAALPFVHRKSGELWFEGKRYLNTTDVRALEPMPEIDELPEYDFDKYGRKRFPWNHSFLRALFEPPRSRPRGVPGDVELGLVPLYIFLAWLKRCYSGAVFMNPLPRQAVVLAGPEGAGKTFLVTGIMSSLLGPVADGTGYLVDGRDFNSIVAERPIMFVDDSTPAANPDMHRRFSAMLKKLTACSLMRYNKKYGAEGMTEWRGCAVMAANLDPESQRSLPNLDQSNLDKLSLFQIKRGVHLPGQVEQQKHLDNEMRFLARFLLEWQPPDWTQAPDSYRGRFGVRAYHHEALRESASSTGTPNTVLEVLRDMYEDWVDSDETAAALLSGAEAVKRADGRKAWAWEGRSSRLYRELAIYAPSIIGKLSNNQVSLALGILASKGYGVEKIDNGKWRVHFDEKLQGTFDPTANTEYGE